MFKNKIAIKKNFLVTICFILLFLFAVNTVPAMEMDESNDNCGIDIIDNGNYGINAIDEDKLGNSQQQTVLLTGNSKTLNGGTFSDIQSCILNELESGDTLYLNGEFTTDREETHILVNKKITFTSTSKGTLNAKNLSSIFVVELTGSGSSFSNLIFKNGNGRYGGAVLIYGEDVTISNCLFEDNYAQLGGGAIYTNYYPEDNSAYGRNLLIEKCNFTKNHATSAAGAVGIYGYNNRVIDCIFDSNWVYDKSGSNTYGGAMQVGKKNIITNSLIKDCKFFNNKAISTTGTQLSHGGASCLRDGVTYDNCLFEGNSADFGGALTSHCSGKIENCIFIRNTANDYGGAITNMDDTAMMLRINNCTFDSNSAPYGGAVKLEGTDLSIYDSSFSNNYASIDGGAALIDSNLMTIYESDFNNNRAEHNGGAVYSNGLNIDVRESRFIANVAIANPRVKDDGLGGAIYINGSMDSVKNNIFKYNVARNGSAIYYSKTGNYLTIADNSMDENQAWVYALPIYAKNITYGESEKVGAVIYGGNNIGDYDNLVVSNAIYNAASNTNIFVNDQHPELGARDDGKIYQDAREYNINVLLTIKHSDGTVVYNNTLKSNYLGEISTELTNLKPGKYTVIATHYEDTYYKAITNQTTFNVLPKVDVSITKTIGSSNVNYNDIVVWTLNVRNNGPNDASGVNVSDVLPEGLVLKSSTPSIGTYSNGVWKIGNLASGSSASLQIKTQVTKTGEITNTANVVSTEKDVDMSNNHDSHKITVPKAADLAISKNVNNAHPDYGSQVKWTLTVTNNGPDSATGVVVRDIIPSGLTVKSTSADYANGQWSVGTLGAGQSKTLEIVTSVNGVGTIVNTASVKGNEYDYNMANNNASKGISCENSVDLAISKAVNNVNPDYGDSVTWTLTVRNKGPSDATGVKVEDALPKGLAYQSCTPSVGSYANGVWTVGGLASGQTATLNIVTKVTKTGSIKNVAVVSGNEPDLDESNNRGDASINVRNAADLEVIKNVNNTSPNYGDIVKWTVTVKNNGPDMANGVVLNDLLPEGLVLKSTTGNYMNGKWTISSLNVGESRSFEITTLVKKTGSITNKASASGREHDHNLKNNDASKTVDVSKASDLSISKIVNNSAPNYGNIVKWTITVKNNGPNDASGVKVNDIMPDGLVYQSYSASVGTYSNGVWTIGYLTNGDSVTLNIISKVSKTGTIKNVASVKGNEFDIDESNNVDDASITVRKAADLEISKKVNNTNPNYGDSIKWTLTVRNNGPDAATGVNVSEILPQGLIYRSSTPSVGSYSNGVWSIGTLASGQTATLIIVTKINKTGNIKNIADVKGSEVDIDESNNKDDATVTVPNAADLEVTKDVNNTSPNYGDIVKWTVTVRNNGPDMANDIVLNDLIPAGLVLKSTTGNYMNGKWTIASLTAGESRSFEITTLVNKTGSITNSVSAYGREYDHNPSNNNASKTINVAKAADLSINKDVNNTAPNYLDVIEWTLTVINNGPDTATEVTVSDVLPSGLVIKSVSGDYSNGKWSIGSLASGKFATLKIIAIVNKTGSLINVANVTGDEFDYDLSNNNASKAINVPDTVDLSVIKLVNNTRSNYLDLIKWTLIVKNNGPDMANNVVLSDVLPSGLIIKSVSSDYVDGKFVIKSLNVGEYKSFEIITSVNKTGLLINVANVTSDEVDYNLSNNNASKAIDVPKAADLSIDKVANVTATNYGDSVLWTLTVINNGPDAATDVYVVDVLPKGLIYLFSNASIGNYSNGVWTIGNLANNQTATLTIQSKVNKTGFILNVAGVNANEFDINERNNVDDASIIVPKAADLEVTKLVNNTCPNYGEIIKWTVAIKNNGPDVATGIVLNEILPAGLVLNSTTGNYIDGSWIIASLIVGESRTFEITTLVNKTGSITNKVSALGREYDSDYANNNASKSINVPEAADLTVIKSVNNSSPNYLDIVEWTLTIWNNGPDMANDINVSDVLPESLVYMSHNASVGNYSNGVWSIGSLASGKSVTLRIISLVNATGSLINMANVTANEYDYDLGDNNASEDIDVPKAADLSVIKAVNNTAPNYLDCVEWTLTVINNGPDAATDINVSDVLPDSLDYMSHNASLGSYSDGIWSISTLVSGESASLRIITKVIETGLINNMANVTGIEYDINKTNNVINQSVDVVPACDLEIIKVVNNSNLNYHDSVLWTLIVNNHGPDAAHNVVVNDVLPEGLIIESENGNYSNGNWVIGTLNPYSSKLLEIITYINATGVLINDASVSADEYDYNNSNNNASEFIDVPASADLEIIKLVNDSNPNYGEIITWILFVKNNGPDEATDVSVSEVLGEEFKLISSTSTKGHYINDTWSIGNLDNGEEVTLEIIVKIIKTGNFTNVAVVTGKEHDYSKSNNGANKSIAVDPAVDLEINKKVNATSPNYNDIVKWTVTIRNNGPDKANGIEITDVIPNNLKLISQNASKGFYEDGIWKFCCLEVNEVVTLEIVTRVVGVGKIENVASANATEYDYNPDNNHDNAVINVAKACDLEIIKSVNDTDINYHDLVEWTLIVKNNGPSDATGVVVNDLLPEGLTYVSSKGDGSYSAGGLWNVGNLASGQSKELKIISRADKTGEFNNVAVVKGDQYDYRPSNNNAEKSVNVAPASDLSIIKTSPKTNYNVGDLITFSIVVINNGPDTARNILVSEIMDDSLDFESYSLTMGEYDVENNLWHIDYLKNGEKAILNITARAAKEGSIANRVSVTSDTFDYGSGNNFAEVILNVTDNVVNPSVPGESSTEPSDAKSDACVKVEMKKTGIPLGLLIVISLISIAFSNLNILKKR